MSRICLKLRKPNPMQFEIQNRSTRQIPFDIKLCKNESEKKSSVVETRLHTMVVIHQRNFIYIYISEMNNFVLVISVI